MVATILEPHPLSEKEKLALLPCLVERGLSPDLLDLMTNVPEKTKLIKVHSDQGDLLGLTNVLVTESLFMKHCFGSGNHIGTNTTFFFAQKENRAHIVALMFQKLLDFRPYGHYVGFVDEDMASEFRKSLVDVHHVVADKVLESGSIEISGPGGVERLIKAHGHLKRHMNYFRKHRGTVQVHEGAVQGHLADEIVACCLHSYRKNTHPGVPIDISSYGEQIRDFLASYPNAVTIYTRVYGHITGVQIFIRHAHHLELTEGGFAAMTYRAYEQIVVESVHYCQEHGLQRVSYGLILNETKDRLMDKSTRIPVFLLMLFRHPLDEPTAQRYRTQAHERFGRLFWKDRAEFLSPAL